MKNTLLAGICSRNAAEVKSFLQEAANASSRDSDDDDSEHDWPNDPSLTPDSSSQPDLSYSR